MFIYSVDIYFNVMFHAIDNSPHLPTVRTLKEVHGASELTDVSTATGSHTGMQLRALKIGHNRIQVCTLARVCPMVLLPQAIQ